MKKKIMAILLLLLLCSIVGCAKVEKYLPNEESGTAYATLSLPIKENSAAEEEKTADTSVPYLIEPVEAPPFTAEDLPAYSGSLVIEINGDTPFLEATKETAVTVALSPLDELGRVGPAVMTAGPETLQHGERGETGTVKPTGWHQAKYAGLVDSDPPYLYNRCHILMWYLTGLTDTAENLMTGTRYFNAEGMLSVEKLVTEYISRTQNHVRYRATPIFAEDELLARGILLEARSIETDDLTFCRFIYNVQPGVKIDYATGENEKE